MSNVDPHPVFLRTNQVSWKTYYRRNLKKEVEYSSNQLLAPVKDSEPPRDQEENNNGDETDVIVETSNNELEHGHIGKLDENDPSLGIPIAFRKDLVEEVYMSPCLDLKPSMVSRKLPPFIVPLFGTILKLRGVRSNKQSVVAMCRAETEYQAMSLGICEEIWLQKVLSDLHKDCEIPLKLFCGNKATISIANNPVQHAIELNMLRLIDVSSKENLTMGAYAFCTFLQANRLPMF
ncbi:putative mitochondrial protein [Cucumis melo var. makuwa]|uniref:Mitochondrial protein n=1 Tax=Cucumis melo var. makuwa TaxID=1194695 RepID=A0A5D3BPP7_CUCMM|nr:putative mitochondrial protein [Cucumis melo var. makuwa]TYK01010.1 putative mitochondrial protein [Cucumis melo var. makuwa]